jgi:chromosome segregation ATPase
MMKRSGKLLTVFVVAVLGAWGCAKGLANPNSQTERIRSLESKCAKLEEDYRTVASARDEARKKAGSLEEENKRLQKQIEAQKAQLQKDETVEKLLVKERDELRQQMETRTNERDVLQFRCERLKKGLQSLLGQDEAYMTAPSPNLSNAPTLGN